MVTLIILPETFSELSDVIGGIIPALDHAFVSTEFKMTTTPALILPFKFILHIESDASYLSEPRSHSRTGGHYYL